MIGVLGTKHKSNHLLIDIDEHMGDFSPVIDRVEIILKTIGIKGYIYNSRSTTNGAHFDVELNHKITPIETVCLQALCGSDWKREANNLRRVLSGVTKTKWGRERFNVLYDRKLKPESPHAPA